MLVATAAAHREAAIKACHFLIDWLKTQAPFWKKEHSKQGAYWVKERHTDQQDAERW